MSEGWGIGDAHGGIRLPSQPQAFGRTAAWPLAQRTCPRSPPGQTAPLPPPCQREGQRSEGKAHTHTRSHSQLQDNVEGFRAVNHILYANNTGLRGHREKEQTFSLSFIH